jgi:hypothetical protein
MSSDLGQAIFRVAFFITFLSGLLMLFLDHHSAEFIAATVTFVIGLIFILVIVVMVRRRR